MIFIKLEDLKRTNITEMYIKDKKRLATVTSIVFLDDKHFVAASLAGAKLYLYHIDYHKNEYQLLSECDTIASDDLTITDLIDYDGKDTLVVSNFRDGSQYLYKINDNKIKHYKYLPKTCDFYQTCHGIKFYPIDKNIICATGNRKFVVNFIDTIINEIIYQISYEDGYNPKDMAFINQNRILVLYTNSKVLGHTVDDEYTSRIVLFEINIDQKFHKILDKCDIPNSHGDCIIYHKGFGFSTNQLANEVNIVYVKDDKVENYKTLYDYDMPHGVAVEEKNNLLAVTNYGDNTIRIMEMPEDITQKYI